MSITMDEEMKEPKWVSEARKNYVGNIGPAYSETAFNRGGTAIEVLNKIIPDVVVLNVLLVGVGIDGDQIICSAEPYRISGFLEDKIDYSLTIIDKNPEVISDIQRRTKIFMTNEQYKSHKILKDAWGMYLRDTKQNDAVIHELHEELVIPKYIAEASDGKMLCSYLESGIRIANIPKAFEEKLASGDLSLINADIATINLPGNHFDFISCPNVMYLLQENGQKLAMYNLSKHTKKGGAILANDLRYIGNSLLPKQGGWFTEQKQCELGLECEILESEELGQTMLFWKK